MTETRLLAVHQVMLTMLLVGVATFVTGSVNYRTGLNAFWMFGIPILISVFGNSDAGSRAMMALVLIFCSLAAVALTGVAFALGP